MLQGVGLAFCSVKDRIAYNMIKRAEEQGIISPERTTLVTLSATQLPSAVLLPRHFMEW
jgi:hypothetical protein